MDSDESDGSPPPQGATTTTPPLLGTAASPILNDNTSAPLVAVPEKKGLEITVSDPAKQGDGLNAYVSYKIHTKVWGEAYRAQFDFDQFTVVRRYSDFAWLRDQLDAQWPGIIIPPLPEKIVLGRFSDEFVEARRRALEKFLKRVAAHSMLRETPQLRVFLEASEEAFARIRGGLDYARAGVMGSVDSVFRQAAVATGAPAGASTPGGLWEWFAESSQSLASAITGTARTGATLRDRTPEDDRFDEARRYFDGFEPHIISAHKGASELVARGKDTSKSLFEFGLAFTLLGQAEQGMLGNALCQLGHTADRLSRLVEDEAEKELLLFVEPTKDMTRVVAAAKHALDVRTQKRVAYEAALTDVMQKRAARAKLASQPSMTARDAEKIAAADQEIARAEAKAEGAKEEFDVVTRRVLVEVERVKREKLHEIKSVVLAFVQLQIEHSQKVEDAWRSVLPDLQLIREHGPSNSNSGSGGSGGDVAGEDNLNSNTSNANTGGGTTTAL